MELNWPRGFRENCFNIVLGLQYERPWLWNLFIDIVSLGLTYPLNIITLASTVFIKSTFQKKKGANLTLMLSRSRSI